MKFPLHWNPKHTRKTRWWNCVMKNVILDHQNPWSREWHRDSFHRFHSHRNLYCHRFWCCQRAMLLERWCYEHPFVAFSSRKWFLKLEWWRSCRSKLLPRCQWRWISWDWGEAKRAVSVRLWNLRLNTKYRISVRQNSLFHVFSLPFSPVGCFSGMRSIAACTTVGSLRPFVLNA